MNDTATKHFKVDKNASVDWTTFLEVDGREICVKVQTVLVDNDLCVKMSAALVDEPFDQAPTAGEWVEQLWNEIATN